MAAQLALKAAARAQRLVARQSAVAELSPSRWERSKRRGDEESVERNRAAEESRRKEEQAALMVRGRLALDVPLEKMVGAPGERKASARSGARWPRLPETERRGAELRAEEAASLLRSLRQDDSLKAGERMAKHDAGVETH